MKEQIVEMSGLSPRVIRVWFQNRRCKDKKNQMKRELQNEKVCSPRKKKNNTPNTFIVILISYKFLYSEMKTKKQNNFSGMMESINGIRMIANSPIPQEMPNTSPYDIDVRMYQPPWQTLTNFAMNANLKSEPIDMEHPDFRRLVHQVMTQTYIRYITLRHVQYNTNTNRKFIPK